MYYLNNKTNIDHIYIKFIYHILVLILSVSFTYFYASMTYHIYYIILYNGNS